MKNKIWMLCINDLHLGSAFSLWPPDFIGSNGAPLNLNKGQKYLWDHWLKLVKEVKKITSDSIDIFCLVGDAVQGRNKKGDGEYIVENSLMYQAEAAIATIEPLIEISNERYVFRGSRYHVGSNAESEEFVGWSIGAVKDDLGHYCWMWLPELDVAGVYFDIAHHQSAVMVNRAMPLERERRFSHQVEEVKRNADVIIRAHAHTQVELMLDGELQIGLMPMQMQSDYAATSKTPNRLLSRWLGICLLEITPSDIDTMRYPVDVHWLRFKHPPLPKREYKGEGEWQKSLLNRILPSAT